MQDILDLIILCIIFAFVWHTIMNSQRYAYEDLFDDDEENLTMEEKPIKITIDNYCGQKVTFTMSADAEIESMFELDASSMHITDIKIHATDKDILIEKEDLT